MEDLRSFSFDIVKSGSQNSAAGYDNWIISSNHYWLWNSTVADSTYELDGFKNISIYKIEITGDVNSSSTPNGQAGLVQNWNLTLKITGQNSIFGGKISATNGYGMIQQAIDPVFKLSELQRSITFPSPILSPKQIIVEGLYADGIAFENATNITLAYAITINVFYKFEGE